VGAHGGGGGGGGPERSAHREGRCGRWENDVQRGVQRAGVPAGTAVAATGGPGPVPTAWTRTVSRGGGPQAGGVPEGTVSTETSRGLRDCRTGGELKEGGAARRSRQAGGQVCARAPAPEFGPRKQGHVGRQDGQATGPRPQPGAIKPGPRRPDLVQRSVTAVILIVRFSNRRHLQGTCLVPSRRKRAWAMWNRAALAFRAGQHLADAESQGKGYSTTEGPGPRPGRGFKASLAPTRPPRAGPEQVLVTRGPSRARRRMMVEVNWGRQRPQPTTV